VEHISRGKVIYIELADDTTLLEQSSPPLFWRSVPELSPRILFKSKEAYRPQMNANIREYFVCAPAAHSTQYKAFAFICVLWRSFADKMLYLFNF